MATTEEYKNGGSASYSFSIEYIKAEDIKVTVDGTALDYTATNPPAQTTEYTVNGSNVIFKQASVSGSTNGGVRIYRETDLGNSDSVTFQAGSSIRAADLNANHKLVRFSAQEKNQEIVTADIRDSAVTSAKIKDGTIVEGDIANSAITSNKIANNAVTTTEILNGSVTDAKLASNSVTTAKILNNAVTTDKIADLNVTRGKLVNDAVNEDKLADLAVRTEHILNSAIVRDKIVADAIDSTKLADNAVGSEHIQTNAVTDSEIATGTLDNRYFTETELTNGALDGRYFTETESDARYFNVSTGDTIKDGDTFPDNDTTIATTAAINDRIIDLVDDVGGFVPIANETSFPTSNPDVNGGAGTIVSVKAASTNLAPSGTTVTIANGRGSGLAVIITGVSATIPSGFGFLVETTTTDHTYAFHRLVPKATEVTTVAGSISNINTVGNAISNVNAVAGNATNINTVAANNTNVTNVGSNISNVNAVHANASNINTVAGINANVTTVAGISSNVTSVANNSSNINSAVSNASNINSAVSNASNINTVAGSISNVNTTATNISSVNTTASNIADVNNFADTYQIAANNPSTDGGGNALAAGDLYFNTSANELKVYNGSSWQGGVTAAGSFASTTGNTFTGDNRYNDNVKALFGTGSDLEIFHSGSNSFISDVGTGDLIFTGTVIRPRTDQFTVTNAAANEVMIQAVADGAASLYYDASKKLETTSSGVSVTGNVACSELRPTSHLVMNSADNQIIYLGAGNDLQIYHDGSNSYIQDTGTGELRLRGTTIRLTDHDGSENFANFIDNGAVELFYDNSKKLETTSGGIEVSGGANFTSGNVSLNDNSKIKLGNADDLQIYHGGTDSHIENSTGQLKLASDTLRITNGAVNETRALFTANGGVQNYYNNVLKTETTNSGLRVHGHIDIEDNDKLRVGTGDDLQIYHDGSNSFISDVGTGGLKILGSAVYIKNASDHDMVEALSGGAVSLFHNNTKRFETTANGVEVSAGRLDVGSVSLSGAGLALADNDKVICGSGDDLQIHHDGFNSYIANTTGSLLIRNNIGTYTGLPIKVQALAGEQSIVSNPNGTVELYYDNSKKLETTSSGVTVTGWLQGTQVYATDYIKVSDGDKFLAGNNDDLQIYHDGTNSYINNDTQYLQIQSSYGVLLQRHDGSENLLRALSNAAVELYYDGSKKFETISAGCQVTGNIYVNDGNTFTAGNSNDLQIWHDGTHSNIYNATNELKIRGQDIRLQVAAGNENYFVGFANSYSAMYYDNSRKFRTYSGGAIADDNLWIGTDNKKLLVGGSADFEIFHNTHNYVNFKNGALIFQNNGTNVAYFHDSNGHFLPWSNNTFDLGSSGNRWRNVYTNDLNLSNEGSSNDVDGTWGDWTIQEGESDLFLKNNRSGKKYKFNLTEVS